MKINEVAATSFGPFANEYLHPAPGLTVVWGLNEAGKSSWHSALHIAVCGLRRGRGANTLADRKVITRHRPWSGASWRVGARVLLDDGDELTIGWDLDAKIATVTDSLGRDRSNEWMTDGAVDLAKLVGLDRESFLATASVRQSDLLGVQENPDKLQDLLQRAAATGSVDATASAALDAIDRFAQENVGLDRSNSSKPLAAAKRAVAEASRDTEAAKEDHRHRLDLVARIAGVSDSIMNRAQGERAIQAALQVAVLSQDLSASSTSEAELDELRSDLRQIEARERAHRDEGAILEARAAVLRAERDLAEAEGSRDEFEQLGQAALRESSEADALDRIVVALNAAAELAQARQDLAAAERRAEVASSAAHHEHDARREVAEAAEASAVAEVILARAVAARTRASAARASELDQRHAKAPLEARSRDDHALTVHSAMERWAERPEVSELDGTSSTELEQSLSELPHPPQGDLQPAAPVIEAETLWRLAGNQVQAHATQRPEEPSAAAGRVDPGMIRALADRLERTAEDTAAIEAQLSASESTSSTGRSTWGYLAAGLVLGLVGVSFGLLVSPAALVLVLVGIGVALLGPRRRTPERVEPDVAALRARLLAAQAQERDRAEAEAELTRLGLPHDPGHLRGVADAQASTQEAGVAKTRWVETGARLDAEHRSAGERLRFELSARAVGEGMDLESAIHAYRTECAEREAAADRSAARPGLEAALAVRRGLEAEADRTRATIAQAEQSLRSAARLIGEDPELPITAIVSSLAAWLAESAGATADQHTASEEWSELQQLLGGGSVGDLRASAAEAEQRVDELDQALRDLGGVPPAPDGPVDEAAQATAVRAAAERLAEARRLLSEAEVQAAPTASAPAEVQACRERVDAAQAHLEQIAPDGVAELQLVSVDRVAELRRTAVERAAAARRRHDQTVGQAKAKERSLVDLAHAQAAFDASERAFAAEQAKHPLADDAGLAGSDPGAIARLLEEAALAAARAADQAGIRRGQIAERERLRQDRGPLESGYHRAVAALDPLAHQLGLDGLSSDPAKLPEPETLQDQLEQVRTNLEALGRELANLEGQLEERKSVGRDPAEAEERQASARAELERVQRLDVVLKKTRTVLASAQEQVHRNIAPRLNAAIDRWMPDLFGDRYQRVLIDPEKLGVKVLAGQVARDATALSQGTAEQIYLLLRIALVEALTAASKESCPMILDDITVHFDAERKVAVLDLLHLLSQERQVILFSQEESVRSWARDHCGGADRLIELPGRVQC